jgi:hypothetical protein
MTVVRPARAEGLDVHDVEDGLVVYDTKTSRVHYLNATATLVFELCDGTRPAESIVELVASAWDLPEPPNEQVQSCLHELREEGVIT